MANYNKLDSRGLIPENTLIENRDIIISKVVPIKENKNDHTKLIKYEDQSKMCKTNEDTYIDKNFVDRNGKGYNFAKVKTRTIRKPVIGDKFSSRHGQKGTIGNIIPECDMPFTADGLKPDIIINPHAIPSRMTIGQLKETLLGKVLLQLGLFGDGTSFGDFHISEIRSILQDNGYESNGNQLMQNGLTGEQLECSVFIGPVFYQRLKHMVNDKAHSRSNGPMVNLTRQPAEGRSKDGGLRFGEMERDCFTEDHQILTNQGFMFLKELEEKQHDPSLLIASYSNEKLVYEKMNELIIHPSRTQTMIEITQETENVSVISTPNHDIFIRYINEEKYKKVKACELYSEIKSNENMFVEMKTFAGNFEKVYINNIEEITYTGRTWCVSVPSTVIIVRRAFEHDNVITKASVPIVIGNCIASHGATRFMKERMYDVSDKYSVFVCKKCGLIAAYNDKFHIHHCRTCDNRTDFAYVKIPYACKLLFQELGTMNVVPRIMTENK